MPDQTAEDLLPHPIAVQSSFCLGSTITVARTAHELVDAVLKGIDASPIAEVTVSPARVSTNG